MSLDVYLTMDSEPTQRERAIALLREHGFTEDADQLSYVHDEDNDRQRYSANITHNLGPMADAAGIGDHLWQPEKIGITTARQLIEPLRNGLELMRADPEKFKQYNSPNGWGLYENFVPWVASYLNACEEYPDAKVSVSR